MKIPSVIVSTEPIDGVSSISDSLSRYFATTFRDDNRVKIFLSQLHGLGLESIACSYNTRLIKVLKSMKGTKDFQIHPIVLNPAGISRDIQNYGIVGFAKRRLSSAGIPNLLSLALTSLRYSPGVLKMDYSLLSILLAELELLEFRGFSPRVVFLHPSMSDMALANRNESFFKLFTAFFHGKHGVEPGIMSNNIGFLLEELDEWDINVEYVAGPINRRGYHMKPNQQKCEELIKKANRVIIATEVSSVTPPAEEDIEYLKKLNVSSFMVELGNALDGVRVLDLTRGHKHG